MPKRQTTSFVLTVLMTLVSAAYLLESVVNAEVEARSALVAQRKALTNAVTRGDAAGVAKLFSADAKLMLPGFETVTGREAIQKFWQAGLSGRIIKGIAFAPADFTGEEDGLLAETGTLTTFAEDGKEKDQSRYLIVWKREESEWRIHRDIVNSELAPAPRMDRVGFPNDYRTMFKVLGVPARANTDPLVVMTAYGNDLANSVTNTPRLPYPNGSIILMEFAKEGFRLLSKKIQQASAKYKDPAEQLKTVADAYWNFAFKNKEYYQLMYGLGMAGCEIEKCFPERADFRNLVMEPIAAIIAKSKNPKVNPCLKYYTFWSILHGLISIKSMRNSNVSDEVNKMVMDDAIEGFIKNLG